MRRLITLAAIGVLATAGVPSGAAARTSNAVCKAACAPRIAEQCAGLAGAELRKCPRLLLKACKKTTPEIGCPTTADVTAALNGQVLHTVAEATTTDLALCTDGRFTSNERALGASPDDVGFPRSGAWAVRIVGAGLGLVLADEGAEAPLRVERAATGGFLLDGNPTAVTGNVARCGPSAAEARDAERAISVDAIRTLTDRALAFGPGVDAETITLCSSGLSIDRFDAASPGVEGGWSVDVSGGDAILTLGRANGSSTVFGLQVRADGAVALDGDLVERRDARAECASRDEEQRLTAALNDTAFFFVVGGTIPLRTKLGLCDSGRYRLDQTSTEHGNWRVEVTATGANLLLVRDGAQTVRRFPVAFDDNGVVLVDQSAPIDEPSLVAAACAG